MLELLTDKTNICFVVSTSFTHDVKQIEMHVK